MGRTTLCAHLAWHFSQSARVLAIDLDQQANLTHTLCDGETSPMSSLDLFTSGSDIPPNGPLTVARSEDAILDLESRQNEATPLAFRDNLHAADNLYDVCIIDTPPQLGVRVVSALVASDAYVSPIDLGDYSILGIRRLMDFQAKVASFFGLAELDFLGLLPSRFDRKSPRERALFDQLVAAGLDIPLFPHYVTKRDAYARSASEKVPVWQMPGTAAREASAEIRAIMAEFERRLFTK